MNLFLIYQRTSTDIAMNLNTFIFYWKRNNWLINPRVYFANLDAFKINEPIFLLGNQGDGLTLLSRMLRRHHSIVSATGNASYWSGASEMQNVFEPILGYRLSGIRLNAPKHYRLKPPRSWSYACDDLISQYRKVENEATYEDSRRLKKAIRIAVAAHGKGIEKPRFVDKSQVFTVKVSFISKLLQDNNPLFIYLTRNPYASIYRAALGKAGDMKRYSNFLSLKERFQICLEHWRNTAKAIEEDKEKVPRFKQVAFEHLLMRPEAVLRDICEFVGLNYSENLLPQPHHKLPLGTRYEERWYPLRPDVNNRYLNEIPKEYVCMIKEECGELAERYGYLPPE